MTLAEKEALLGYLEFTLTKMVEGLEAQGIVVGDPQVGAMYDAAYGVLNEMEETLAERIELAQSVNDEM